mmetsp:Transcript_46776/g.99982  ORF Transcript_46776/g.99982 Transcript_46776/m.99982 type:complete len:332 (+) Transcript_46776:126-1121(+)
MVAAHPMVRASRTSAESIACLHEDLANLQLPEAYPQKGVLAQVLPCDLILAARYLCEVGLHRLARENLNGSIHHGPPIAPTFAPRRHLIAVRDEDASTCRRSVGHRVWIRSLLRLDQVLAEPHAHKHSVRIHLDGPILLCKAAIAMDRLPSLHEDQLVRRCTVLGIARYLRRGYVDCGHPALGTASQLLHHIAKNGMLLATEDARAHVELSLEQVFLRAVHACYREAEERGQIIQAALRGARPGATRSVVAVHVALEVLKGGRLGQAWKPVGMPRDARGHGPDHACVAFLTIRRGMALAGVCDSPVDGHHTVGAVNELNRLAAALQRRTEP